MYRYFKSLAEDYIFRIYVDETNWETDLEIYYLNGGTGWHLIATGDTKGLLESVLNFNNEIEITQGEVNALVMAMELKK